MLSQKALQQSETIKRELLGGMKENRIFSNEGSLICPDDFSQKVNREQNELVTKPAALGFGSGRSLWPGLATGLLAGRSSRRT